VVIFLIFGVLPPFPLGSHFFPAFGLGASVLRPLFFMRGIADNYIIRRGGAGRRVVLKKYRAGDGYLADEILWKFAAWRG
jgi:hypothetical protein